MQSLSHAGADYNRIEKAIKFLENNFSSQPGLKDIAAHLANACWRQPIGDFAAFIL